MNKLAGLEPKKVFEFFEYISSVPRGSGNTSAVADLCVKFAKDRGLSCYRDKYNNVIIYKSATPGYENEPTVVIQGHLDMVCSKDPDCCIDMAKEPIELAVDNEYVFAKGTTLGADDGIAIAYALAVLDSDDIEHPAIEAVFTIDEEVGMDGAAYIDGSKISGRILLNIDSEDEGIFTCGCAGGCIVNGEIGISRENMGSNDKLVKISVYGLKGGHSGTEINKQPASANNILGRILYELYKESKFRLVKFAGGKFDNVITENSEAVLSIDSDKVIFVKEFVENYEKELFLEYGSVNPDLKCGFTVVSDELSCSETECKNPVTLDDTLRILQSVYFTRQGVIEMNMDLKDMVQTSQNLGILVLEEDCFKLGFLVRSSIEGQKKTAIKIISDLIELLGGKVSYTGDYPGWNYRADSKVREKCEKIYCQQYGKKPLVLSIHAGLECGIFINKLPGLDAVSFGPDILDIHTPRERLNIESVKRVWEFLLAFLKEK